MNTSCPPKILMALALPVFLPACSTTAGSNDTSIIDDGIGSEDEARVTFYDDVLPVLTTHCQSCHTEGGLGPFPVDDYEEVKAWGAAMVAATRARTMPPFPVDASGDCNEFADAQWLDDEEIALIEQWVEEDMAAGDAAAPRIPAPEPISLRDTGEVVPLQTPRSYTPVAQSIAGLEYEDYQCFLTDYRSDVDRFLTGFDVAAGNLETVHHVLVFEVDPAFVGNGAQMRRLDEESPDQAGWDCFGGAGDEVIPDGVPVVWAPGTGAVNYPEGTGIRIEAGHQLGIQMHYNLVNDDGADSSTVELAMADRVEREAIQELSDPFLFSALAGAPESLPPRRENAEYTWEETLAETLNLDELPEDARVEVFGILPHMHERGRTMMVEFDHGDRTECGAHVDRWDFNWQRMYFFDAPLTMRLGDSVRVTCGYDTSADTEPVLPGFGTAEEMCLVALYAVPI